MNPTELQAIGDTLMRVDARDDTETVPKGCKEGTPGRVEKGHRSCGVLLDYFQC
ncbi:hypothetical protein [Mesorhizobium sp.]|uniref:hypothetical protein n=1 Tax=Mesorhizobium sp. TaxID=1871066 RepID=UPI00257B079C|nr:hypothetical protein [Mesorhizobium sp.]